MLVRARACGCLRAHVLLCACTTAGAAKAHGLKVVLHSCACELPGVHAQLRICSTWFLLEAFWSFCSPERERATKVLLVTSCNDCSEADGSG